MTSAVLIGLTVILTFSTVHAQESLQINTAFVSSDSITLAQLVEGNTGDGWLLYYRTTASPQNPLVAVHLVNEAGSPSRAYVFDSPNQTSRISLKMEEGAVIVPEDLRPAITVEAVAGWWVRGGVVNYNLDITVYGQVAAMWGATLDVKGGPQFNWPLLLEPGEPNAQIIVRDTDSDGVPDWDWRTMLPEFPFRGDYRTNYAERKCSSPVTVERGVSPEWPFVAHEGGFEQGRDVFRPPIVVDWETGRVKYFSELVSIRNQNCSYSIYSIERILPGQLNSPNFETPFAFYDLSGEGVGYPNLLLRTERTIENEALLRTANPETQSIRYSWRNEVGDWEWDYKVDVLGRYQYDYQTPIAGGEIVIDAPPYEAFPGWVVGRDWPVASFVAMEQTRYRSSEGIYEWSMLGLTDDYFFGWQQEPDLSQFEDIRVGLRGEYRLTSSEPPETYFSPIDNRLHLKWAEHGLWRLDDEQIIRVTNFNEDEHLDVWSREALAATVAEDARTQALSDAEPAARPPEEATESEGAAAEPAIIETLYALPGHLLHSSAAGLALVAAEYEPALFETLPPTDHETWEAHRAQLAPYEAQRRDPADLRSWLDAFPGPRSEIAGASVANVRITADGFRFELKLEPGFQPTGPDLLGIYGLEPGPYLVEYEGGRYRIAPLAPPHLSIAAESEQDLSNPPAVQLQIENAGLSDARSVELVVENRQLDGRAREVKRIALDVPAGETLRLLIGLPGDIEQGSVLDLWIENAVGERLAQEQLLNPGTHSPEASYFLLPGISSKSQAVSLAAVALCLIVLVGIGARFVAGNDSPA